MDPKRDRPLRQIDSKVRERERDRGKEGMLNFDKDRKLLFQCRPFSNQWPCCLWKCHPGQFSFTARREREIETDRDGERESERVAYRTARAADFH